MAALGNNHGGGFCAVAPVTAHEGMTEVPGTHAFIGVKGHHLAQLTAADDVANGVVEGRVA